MTARCTATVLSPQPMVVPSSSGVSIAIRKTSAVAAADATDEDEEEDAGDAGPPGAAAQAARRAERRSGARGRMYEGGKRAEDTPRRAGWLRNRGGNQRWLPS